MKRRTLLQSIPVAALLPESLLSAMKRENGHVFPDSSPVYELRVYQTFPGKLPDLFTRFRDHTVKLFDKHGMKSIAYWTPTDDPKKNSTLIYVLQHPSREAATANWKSFVEDPEWISVRDKSEANGQLVEKLESTFMALTDFSPRLK
jgi:NIPSNAP